VPKRRPDSSTPAGPSSGTPSFQAFHIEMLRCILNALTGSFRQQFSGIGRPRRIGIRFTRWSANCVLVEQLRMPAVSVKASHHVAGSRSLRLLRARRRRSVHRHSSSSDIWGCHADITRSRMSSRHSTSCHRQALPSSAWVFLIPIVYLMWLLRYGRVAGDNHWGQSVWSGRPRRRRQPRISRRRRSSLGESNPAVE